MEPKTRADGRVHDAASLTKVCTLLLFIATLVLWLAFKNPPDTMVYTLWGLLGVRGAEKTARALRG